jgi:hypothetical protein
MQVIPQQGEAKVSSPYLKTKLHERCGVVPRLCRNELPSPYSLCRAQQSKKLIKSCEANGSLKPAAEALTLFGLCSHIFLFGSPVHHARGAWAPYT